jgi:hypothetical protein
MAPRDPHAPVQALSSNNINQREVGPLQAVALGPTEAVALSELGLDSTRPAVLTRPCFQIAISQKSRCTSTPMQR